jgi:hypothetical protein
VLSQGRRKEEKKIKRKTRERPAGPRSWAATGKLGWAAQDKKERKSGMRMRETNGQNSKNNFIFILLFNGLNFMDMV